MDEVWRQLVAVVLGLLGAGPFFYQMYRDRRTREKLQAQARRNLDGWGNAMALLQRYLIIESDVDDRIKTEAQKLEADYEAAWREYSGVVAKDEKKA